MTDAACDLSSMILYSLFCAEFRKLIRSYIEVA